MSAPDTAQLPRRAFVLACAVLVLALAVLSFPFDDGLRHVGKAFGSGSLGSPSSWGQTYPYSVFALYDGCHPWLGYDLALGAWASLASALPLDRLLLQFLTVKLLIGLFCAALLGLAVRRSRLLDEVTDPGRLLFALLLIALVLCEPLRRATTARPFSFGTLFVLYAVGSAGFARGFGSAALLSLLYPYLAFLYALPVALAHWIKGNRAFGLGAAGATGLGLALQPTAFWSFLGQVALSDRMRAGLVPQIREFVPAHEQPLVPLFFVLGAALLFGGLPAGARKLRLEHVLMALFLPVSLKYLRYFIDLELPLLFVAHARDVTQRFQPPLAAYLAGWGGKRAAAPAPARRPRAWLRVVLVLGYGLVAVLGVLNAARDHRRLLDVHTALAELPRGALVLTEFNLQYDLLYARPDLRVVPSSEIGFAAPEIRARYLGFMNRGEVCELARQIGASHFVEGRGQYLDPAHTGCLKASRDGTRLRVWRVQASLAAEAADR